MFVCLFVWLVWFIDGWLMVGCGLFVWLFGLTGCGLLCCVLVLVLVLVWVVFLKN